jgi:hypothetical protein
MGMIKQKNMRIVVTCRGEEVRKKVVRLRPYSLGLGIKTKF